MFMFISCPCYQNIHKEENEFQILLFQQSVLKTCSVPLHILGFTNPIKQIRLLFVDMTYKVDNFNCQC